MIDFTKKLISHLPGPVSLKQCLEKLCYHVLNPQAFN